MRNDQDLYTVRRGHHRGFVQQTINHEIRWIWRVLDLSSNKQVADGITTSREEAIREMRNSLDRSAR